MPPVHQDRWQRIETLFYRALELEGVERAAFVEDQTRGDDGVRRELEQLLAGHEEADERFLSTYDAEPGALLVDVPVGMLAGRRVGDFTLREVLAEGGMGTVYRAEQASPRREVALKLLRTGLHSPQAVRRFEFESEVLARLDHPNVARVLSSGTFDAGGATVPWFALELIDGARPIVDYVEREELDLRARVELFLPVALAIDHGHRRGVIHRDIKPSNVLVGDDGRPRVIDFGVARLGAGAGEDAAAATLHTRTGEILGTLTCMSPEQTTGDPARVDVRSDVYSLGVLLYRLLAGVPPLEVAGLPIAEALRVIQSDVPRAPSHRAPSVPPDLDAVTLKCLAKEPELRYASVGALASDLRRFLAGEPVTARAPGVLYRLRLFTRRNRAVVASLAVVIVGLSVATGWSVRESLRAQRAAQRAANERAIADAVNRFLNEHLIAAAAPERLGIHVTLLGAVDVAAEALEGQFPDQPLVEAGIRQTLAETYHKLAAYSKVDGHLARALELRRAELGPDHPDTLKTMSWYGQALVGVVEPEEARALLQAAHEGQRRQLGGAHPETIDTLRRLRSVHSSLGEVDEQLEVAQRICDLLLASVGPDDANTIEAQFELGTILRTHGQRDEAVELQRAATERFLATHGELHPRTLQFMFQLAVTLRELGRLEEAEDYYRRSYEGRLEVLGEENTYTMFSLGGLALAYKKQGKFAEAEPLYAKALEVQRRVMGPNSSHALEVQYNLSSLYRDTGELERARPLFADLVQRARGTYEPSHHFLGIFLTGQGETLARLDRFEEAEEALFEALDILDAAFGREHPRTGRCLQTFDLLYGRWGRPEESAQVRRRWE